jgi:hypothetical protein
MACTRPAFNRLDRSLGDRRWFHRAFLHRAASGRGGPRRHQRRRVPTGYSFNLDGATLYLLEEEQPAGGPKEPVASPS